MEVKVKIFFMRLPPPKILINMIRARLVYVYMYIIVRIYFFFTSLYMHHLVAP